MWSIRSSKTLLVEGLPLKCTSRDLNNHFSNFGQLTGCTLMINKETGKCRGFGFVTFLWAHQCKMCVDFQPHIIRGTKITLRVLSDYSTKGFEMNLSTKVLLVSFVGKRLEKLDIMEYFSRFGAVSVELDDNKENMANFAYVTFESEQMCKNCALNADHFICGYRVLVWPAVRREVYKVMEQAERERIARNEKLKAEDLRYMDSASLPFNQQFPMYSRAKISSCLIPPPPPPLLPRQQPTAQASVHLQLPQTRPDAYASSSAVGGVFVNELQSQTSSSHSWVPLLPSTTSASAAADIHHLREENGSNVGSLMAGYASSQNHEVMKQSSNDFLSKKSCGSPKFRNTWARLIDLPVHATNAMDSYTTPQYFYKT